MPSVTVTRGDAVFNPVTGTYQQIDQASLRAIYEGSMTMGSNAHLHLNHAVFGRSGLGLFKDVSGSLSQIFGRITSNGQVFISNPNGVLFGSTARVDVGGLFATTLSTNDDQFMAGGARIQWTNNGATGTVTNQGEIITAGGYTALAGPQVRNDGIIRARTGSVALAAGDRVNLDLIGDGLISISVDQAAMNASAVNTGTIEAEGGTVLLTARSANALLDTVVNAGGVIRASSLIERNGEIVLDGGNAGAVLVAGNHNAGSSSVSGADVTMRGTIVTDLGSGSQTVSTPGTLRIEGVGGSASNSGFIHQGSGEQRVEAANLLMEGGTGVGVNAVITSSNANADQRITVSGNLQVKGGAAGDGNQAIIRSAGNQTIDGNPNITVEGGASSGPGGANTAFIVGATSNAPGKKQTITASSITMRSGAGGFQNGAVILGPRQEITTTGDVLLAGGGTGGTLGGVRMGGLSTGAGGVANTPTDLKLSVGNDLLMRGGVTPSNSANIGSTTGQAQTIVIAATRDVIVNDSATSVSRIGTVASTLPTNGTPGSISVSAGRDIKVNSGGEIVTTGTVTLAAVTGAVNVNATSLSTPTAARVQSGAGQDIQAQTVNVTASNGRTAQLINAGTGTQSVKAGTVEIQTNAPVGGLAEIRNNSVADQKVTVTGERLAVQALGGGTATITGNGNQTIDMTRVGAKTITLGDNLAQGTSTIVSNGDQKVLGYADINMTGGSGPNAAIAIISASNPGRTQRVEANNLTMSNSTAGGGGNGSVAAILGAKQTVHALGNVTLTANASGGTLPGVRIGGLGGAGTLATATDLTLTVGGNLELRGSNTTANNGVGIGASGAVGTLPLANNITIDAGGNVILSAGSQDGSGVRIGTSTNTGTGTGPGEIRIKAGGSIELNGTAQPAAIRTLGNVTLEAASISEGSNGIVIADTLTTTTSGITNLAGPNEIARFNGTSGGVLTLVDAGGLQVTGISTTNDVITLTTDSLTNAGTISNGGPASTANIILNADAFSLAGGRIEGNAAAVAVRPRTGTNSFGIESAGATTLTNADIASINTSNFIVFGSGIGTTFTGNMTIGENARVEGGAKNLAFFRGTAPGLTTIGSQGVATTGDVIVSAGLGAINSNGGTVRGDEVQLRAGNGIGSAVAPVRTAANALAMSNSSSAGVFVSELDNVTLRTISLNVGGMLNTFSNGTAGVLDFNAAGAVNAAGIVSSGPMTLTAGGSLTLDGAVQDAALLSGGGQTITAQSINLTAQNGRRANIENTNGNQSITATAGDMNLQAPSGVGVAQIVNTGTGNQTIEASGQLNVLGGATGTGSTNSGVFKNGPSGLQKVTAAGITLQGASTGTNAGAGIRSQSDQEIRVSGDINLRGGNGGNLNNAFIAASATGQQAVYARDINMSNGVGGIDTSASITAGHQLIDLTGNLTMTSQAALLGTAAGGPGVRIGAPGGSTIGTDLRLLVDGNVTLNGGTAGENGAAIGSSGAGTPAQNTIHIEAGGNVILNAGTLSNTGVRIGSGSGGTAGGNIEIKAGRSIELNGSARSAAIRTLGDVSLDAGSIREAANGNIIAGALSLKTTGDATLGGANQVNSLSAFVLGTPPVPGLPSFVQPGVGGNLVFNNTAPLNVSSTVASGGTMTMTVAGALNVTATTQDAALSSVGGQSISAQSLAVTASNGRAASVSNSVGAQTINLSNGAGLDVQTQASGGSAQIGNNGGGSQTISVVNGDHINVNGVGGVAWINDFGGSQSISITGSGANAITLGAPGSLGPSQVFGGTQSITAGTGIQTGSITIVGGNGNSTFTGFSSGQIVGGTQTVSTSGSLRIDGGEAPSQPVNGFATGLFHNGSGEQKVSAANLAMHGGPSGVNNVAIIISSGGAGTIASGKQVIDVGSGNLSLDGGSGGNGNTAIIVSFTDQKVTAGSVALQGGAGGAGNGAFINSVAGGQLFNVAGELRVAGGAGGSAGINNGSTSPLNTGASQVINAGSVALEGGAAGSGNGAFINSNFGGSQTLTVPGTIRITGGSGGVGNRAGILTNANQTINGNPDIFLEGGSGGGVAGNGNNVFIQATGGDTTLQTINARNVRISAGAGTDASATFNAARQVITTTGDVSLFGSGGLGSLNGVRIGGIGGTTLGPTNLALGVGGNVLLHGGTANGASLGSSAASTQSNNITVTASGNVTLESEGAGARIGTSSQVPVTSGNIAITAGGSLQLDNGTAVRTSGPITLTANSLSNAGTITNGGGTNSANMIFNANSFHLAGGTVEAGAAAVIVRPRTGTNSFGIESAGQTTLTNADIASIHTSDFVVFGSGIGTTFTGNMTIGQNARVEGGGKNLAFFRSSTPGGTTTIGSGGVSTTGNVILSAGGGAIVSEGGTVAGDQVQLRASQGIGSEAARVQTSANRLALNNTGPQGAFVVEAGDVTLGNVNLRVGGIANNVSNTVGAGGSYDVTAGGSITVSDLVQAGSVKLATPAGAITEVGAGAIVANQLSSSSGLDTSLLGDNRISELSASSGTDFALNNIGALTVTGLSAGGNAALDNVGNVTITGPWTAGGSSHITAHSDIVLGSVLTSTDVVLQADGSITEFGTSGVGAVVANTLTTVSGGSTFLGGENRVANYSGTSGGELSLFNRGDLNVSALGANTANLSNNGALTISGPWITTGATNVTAFGGPGATLSETPGGFIQATGFNSLSADGSVTLNGPNRISGNLFGSSMQGGDFRLSNSGDLNFGAFVAGDVNFVNTGVLNVTSLSGRNLAVTNTGPMTVSGFWNSTGTTSMTTTGSASDLTVSNQVFSQGAMTINVDGALTVAASGMQVIPPPPPGLPPMPPMPPSPQVASLYSSGGQTITAKSVLVWAHDGALAMVNNQTAGGQTITVSGGGIDVRTSGGTPSGAGSSNAQVTNFGPGSQSITVAGPAGLNVGANGGFASITNNTGSSQAIQVTGGTGVDVHAASGFALISNALGAQNITVSGGKGIDVISTGGSASIQTSGGAQTVLITNADHLAVNGIAGQASMSTFGGMQTLSITGQGANALTVGSQGAVGTSFIGGFGQVVTAGVPGEEGSIRITGTDAPDRFAGITNNSGQGIAPREQNISVAGTLAVTGGRAAGQFIPPAPRPPVLTTSNAGIFNNANASQIINAGGIEVRGGARGLNNGAFISSGAGGNQTITVNGGVISIAGGDGGSTNRAGLTSTGNQTINGNPDIFLVGGASGTANNAFIQATGSNALQTINARNVEMRAGTGLDASATLNAARQVVSATGDVSLIGSGGAGTLNGVRIGGLGQTLAPTNLTLDVGGSLFLHGGTASGVSLGSSAASTQSNNITITAAGNVTLESEGGGARIGTSNQVAVTTGNIAVTAGGSLQLDNGTAVRTSGPITLTANSLSNAGTITNGGGTNSANMIFNANSFHLAGGTVEAGAAAVILRPRTGTNSFGIESAGQTTLTNADIASIHTSDFVVFGSGMGTTFTGNMTIGENARVEGGDKNLAFFRSSTPGGTTTIGVGGVYTTGNVIVSAGGGAIVSNGGAVSGDQVQLRASQGIGSEAARVQTSANRLALSNTGPQGAFVFEAGDVTLGNVNLTVGGIANNVSNTIGGGGTFDVTAGGSITVSDLVQAGSVTLTTPSGAITEVGAGAIVASRIATTSGLDTSLLGANQISELSASSGRDFSLSNTSAVLSLGSMDLPGNLAIVQTGDVAVGNASATSATLISAAGDISMSATGQILVRGSDTTSGAASAVLAGGELAFSAGDVMLRAGDAALTPVVVRGANGVQMTVGNELNVTAGALLSPSLLTSGRNIDLTIGRALRIDGSGPLSLARVQTESREGVISIEFPNLTSGGYFVDGLEGHTHHGQTGFFTGFKAAKVGSTLLLEYGN